MGDAGDNVLHGGAGNDSMYGYEGNDTLYGHGGNDTIQAHEGDDRLYGGDGDDTLYSGFGYDLLDGGAGSDRLFAGPESDLIRGGSGADLFGFAPWEWTNQSPWVHRIDDFEHGIDKIDVSRLDADESTTPGVIKGKNTPGNEAFQLVESTDGVTAGHLVITRSFDSNGAPITIISGYTNTTPGADVVIHVTGTPVITASDFIL